MLYLALPGLAELWPILVILLLLFGAKKLPELAKAMGSSINQFKKGLDEAQREELPESTGSGSKTQAVESKEETTTP